MSDEQAGAEATSGLLVVFAGLPATGKSTVSQAFARHVRAPYLRLDSIEQSLVRAGLTDSSGAAGYVVAHALALDHLLLGLTAVVDCVNPLELTRSAWHETASRASVPVVDIEIVCSDIEQHRYRAEHRVVTVPELIAPTWQEIVDRDYAAWTTPRLVIDTAAVGPDLAVERILEYTKSMTTTAPR
ncbi:putative kinase [Rhodococcus sp. 27YEA15]|uniref:AAA family ATPase n=1 Tax=Rhodococcus sp. 27YEA15 TaxID=3156259 RepID=UPI003C7BEEAB